MYRKYQVKLFYIAIKQIDIEYKFYVIKIIEISIFKFNRYFFFQAELI